MINLNINQEEKRILVETLESCISDLRMEIVDTDSLSYREKLKVKKRVLSKLLHSIDDEVIKSEE